jgi:hypothetical protein
VTGLLARLRALHHTWATTPAVDFTNPAIGAVARACDAIDQAPAYFSRRTSTARIAQMRRELDRLDTRRLEDLATYRRTLTILGGQNAALARELERLRQCAAAAGMGHIFEVRVPEQRTGTGP